MYNLSQLIYWPFLPNSPILVYFITCWVYSYLEYSANKGIYLFLVRQIIHPTVLLVSYLGIEVFSTNLASKRHLTFPFSIEFGHKWYTKFNMLKFAYLFYDGEFLHGSETNSINWETN